MQIDGVVKKKGEKIKREKTRGKKLIKKFKMTKLTFIVSCIKNIFNQIDTFLKILTLLMHR